MAFRLRFSRRLNGFDEPGIDVAAVVVQHLFYLALFLEERGRIGNRLDRAAAQQRASGLFVGQRETAACQQFRNFFQIGPVSLAILAACGDLTPQALGLAR